VRGGTGSLVDPVRYRAAGFRKRASRIAARAASHVGAADVAVFHEFAPPPSGGGHQFLRALLGELSTRGLRIEHNRRSRGTRVCLCNSFNFDFGLLRSLARDARIVHRVDGPIGVYRGFDDGTDERLWELNRTLAHATIFQSHYSLRRHRELGLEFADPVVVPNAPDGRIFWPAERAGLDPDRPVRLVVSSWSDNPRKGGPLLAELEQLLEPERFELTFVGRTQSAFERVRRVEPLDPAALAALLRTQDVYLALSRDEPCSNALLEALASGLPALYLDSGSNGELVKGAGLGFTDVGEAPALLERLAADYDTYRAAIAVTPLPEVADAYADVLGLG